MAEIALIVLAVWYVSAWVFLSTMVGCTVFDRDERFRLAATFLAGPALLLLFAWFWFWFYDVQRPLIVAWAKRAGRNFASYWSA